MAGGGPGAGQSVGHLCETPSAPGGPAVLFLCGRAVSRAPFRLDARRPRRKSGAGGPPGPGAAADNLHDPRRTSLSGGGVVGKRASTADGDESGRVARQLIGPGKPRRRIMMQRSWLRLLMLT